MITEAVRSTEQRYLRAITRALALRDRAIDTQARNARHMVDDLRRRLIDELSALPTVNGRIRSDGLGAARSSVDRNVAAFQRELAAAILNAGRIITRAGSNLTPMALVAAGIAPERTTALIHEVAEPSPDFDDLHWLAIDDTVLARIEAALAEQVVGVSDLARHQLRVVITRGLAGNASISTMLSQVRSVLATQPARGATSLGPIASQAERIVRTELLGAFSAGNQARSEQMAAAVPGLRKYWLTAHDARVRSDHVTAGSNYAPGATPGPIPAKQDFMVGGEKCAFPHDPRLSAKQKIQCRCVRVEYKAEWFR